MTTKNDNLAIVDLDKYSPGEHPNLPPPAEESGVFHWLRRNLFSNVTNTLLTLFAIFVLIESIPPLLGWAFFNAHWSGDGPDVCRADTAKVGACWLFISTKLEQFLYGFYPKTEIWRINTITLTLLGLIIYLILPKTPHKKWVGLFSITAYPIIAFLIIYGGVFGLSVVTTDKWGGLTVTLIIFYVGIVFALPLGVILALGRRSSMPIIKSLCTLFIELWRGVPLITVLFMAAFMIPLFLPEDMSFDKLLRPLIGITLFASAYIAEVVRGGLQAIPKGQFEAAASLGMSYWKTTLLIILPQALKMVIPGIVNISIGLFKDTTLVIIIGLFDFLGAIQSAAQDPTWLGFLTEGYVFAALVYFIFCFTMSRYSVHLERKLQTDHKP